MATKAAKQERVYVSTRKSAPNVYHTRRRCPQMPSEYELVEIHDARDMGCRACPRCDDARFEELAL